jgi:hypothetical protein
MICMEQNELLYSNMQAIGSLAEMCCLFFKLEPIVRDRVMVHRCRTMRNLGAVRAYGKQISGG